MIIQITILKLQKLTNSIELRDKKINEMIEKFNNELYYHTTDCIGSLENKFPANNRWYYNVEPCEGYLRLNRNRYK